jgi:hypothetical protein
VADDIVAHLRSVDVERVSTHYHDCWKSHTVCAMRYAADEIERLREALALACGLLSTYYAMRPPDELMQQFLEEARRD